MTCIAAIKHNDTIYMAADNVCSDSWGMYRRSHGKLFYSGDMLVGCAGSIRVAQVIQHAVSYPGQASTQDDHAFMCDTVVEHIRAQLTHRGALRKVEEEEVQGASIMVAYNSNIYVIESDWSVYMPGYPYFAIGSGGMSAQGALYVLTPSLTETSTPEEIKSMLERSLLAAEEHSVGVRGPFDFMTWPPTEET